LFIPDSPSTSFVGERRNEQDPSPSPAAAVPLRCHPTIVKRSNKGPSRCGFRRPPARRRREVQHDEICRQGRSHNPIYIMAELPAPPLNPNIKNPPASPSHRGLMARARGRKSSRPPSRATFREVLTGCLNFNHHARRPAVRPFSPTPALKDPPTPGFTFTAGAGRLCAGLPRSLDNALAAKHNNRRGIYVTPSSNPSRPSKPLRRDEPSIIVPLLASRSLKYFEARPSSTSTSR